VYTSLAVEKVYASLAVEVCQDGFEFQNNKSPST
jgi:hypothetical protein